jgi:hypothetical protein
LRSETAHPVLRRGDGSPAGCVSPPSTGKAGSPTSTRRASADISVDDGLRIVAARLEKLTAACDAAGRDVTELDKVLIHGSSPAFPLTSVDAFVDWAGRHSQLGLTELALHWPVPDSVYASDAAVFEKIVTEGLPQVR